MNYSAWGHLMSEDMARQLGAADGELGYGIFECAPVALWLEDYSGLYALFAQWRAQGIWDLKGYFSEDGTRLAACAAALRVVAVNRRALALCGAASFSELPLSSHRILRDETREAHIEELVRLWNGEGGFAGPSVLYTLDGKRLDVDVEGVVLPGCETDWRRVLVALNDTSAREAERRAVAARTDYAHGLFNHSPVSLWVEDFSAIKSLMDDLTMRGISDFRVFTDVHPEFVERCMAEIRILDVNKRTLEMFRAPDLKHLLSNLANVFREEMRTSFREQLIDLWDGKLFQLREVVSFSLAGDRMNLLMQLSVLPGHEGDWARVQVALTDITARKKAEAYLEFLGKHDVLTGLHNRSYYIDELMRLQRRGPLPISALMIDLNGLKRVNDELGHSAGDALLRRTGEVLAEAVDKNYCAARIGGDEFAVLMPGVAPEAVEELRESIQKLIDLNNTFYPAPQLHVSFGTATGRPAEAAEDTVKRADAMLLAAKRQFYAEGNFDRRRM